MAKFYDADGNEVEGFNQEELDARVKEAAEAEAARVKAEADAARAGENNTMPDWFKPFAEKIGTFDNNQKLTTISRVATGLDNDKQKEVQQKFENLTGYADTPEAQARRAEDAYLLVTGTKYDGGNVNMNNLMASGGGKAPLDTAKVAEADTAVRSVLGITEADVEKFGKKE